MASFGVRSSVLHDKRHPDSPKGATMRKRLTVVVVAAVALAVGGTAVAQSVQRFPDVPPDHEAFEAIEWAATAGVTAGYTDGTFRPEVPLSKQHAVIFMERFYDDILGAEESPDFTRGDMMMLLKAINDGGELAPEPADDEQADTPEPETRWVLNPEGRTAEGRCAPAIVMGIYDWEHCAWGVADDPEMSRADMQALVERVWAEIKARGKPDEPPTLTEGTCGGADVLGCYLASSHTIRLSTGFTLRTLLHELAHALISENAATRACADDWTHRQPECSHGDWYRCAADRLYTRYGGIATAGVCGTPPDLDPGDWWLGEPFETEWGIVHAIAGIADTIGDYYLFARCKSQFGTDGRHLDLGMGLPQDADGDELRIVMRLSGDPEPTDTQWAVSAEGADVVWWPDEVTLAAERWRGTLHIAVHYGDRDTDRARFELGDSPALAIVRSACS